MQTRREFLKDLLTGGTLALGAAAVSPFIPQPLAKRRASAGDRTLVVLELAGGNDGLNTLVPYRNDLYYRLRPTLSVPVRQVLSISPDLGLHPKMRGMAELYESGRVAIVQGVGYPDPSRSHFRSSDIWQSAIAERVDTTSGWIGRFAQQKAHGGLEAIGIGLRERPLALIAREVELPIIAEGDGFSLEVGKQGEAEKRQFLRQMAELPRTSSRPSLVEPMLHATRIAYEALEQVESVLSQSNRGAEYPDAPLARRLRLVADLVTARLGVRVAFLRFGGFDTHAAQKAVHGDLLGYFSDAVSAFFGDLRERGLASKVLLMAYSEFGRRVAENASLGTDHGAAGPVLLCSGAVQGGLYGKAPSLENLDDGDLRYTVDFRQVYSTVLERWLGCPAAEVLGRPFPELLFL